MNVKKWALPASLGIASAWFGQHCGSGFATGSQYVIYYSRHGWTAMIAPILTWTLVAAAMYFILEYGRLTKAGSYKDFAQNFYIKKIGWLFLLFFDIYITFAQILGASGILAGGGALFRDAGGMNYWLGVTITGATVLLIVMFGAKAMLRITTALTACLVLTIVIIGFVGVSQNWDNFVHVVGNRVLTEGSTAGDVISGALTYAGVQIGSLGLLLGFTPEIKDNRDTIKICVGGGILNLVALMIMGLVLIAFYPTNLTDTLPVLGSLQTMNIPILLVLYQILLFLALITTGAGCCWAVMSRNKHHLMKLGLSGNASGTVLALSLMTIGVIGSRFGLTFIFATGYKALSRMSLPLILFPALILGPYRVWQVKKARGNGNEAAASTENVE